MGRFEEPAGGGFPKRRDVLVAGGAAAAGLAYLLGRRSSSSVDGDPPAAERPAGPPRQGGTLRVGVAGGTSAETVDGQNCFSFPDYGRCYALFDHLVDLGPDGQLRNRLAQSVEPNGDGTVWTVRVRDGIRFHNGKPLDSHDVLFSLERIVRNRFPGVLALGPIDIERSHAVDRLTADIHFTAPYAIFREGLTAWQNMIVPVGYDPRNPVGTGPFRFRSFTPEQQSLFVRNDEYWEAGKPYLDALMIIDFADESAMVSALQSGQVDAITYLSAAAINAAKAAGARVVIAKSGAWGSINMRVDRAPFSDPRVREAMRLIPDRQQILTQVFGGAGAPGNDVFGVYDEAFRDHPLPQRKQDLAKARALLREAGYPGLDLELYTTAGVPGVVPSTEAFAAQALEAGVNIRIIKQDFTNFYANSFLKVPFATDYIPLQPYLSTAQLATVRGAPYNSTHESDPSYSGLFAQASATLDTDRRDALIREMRQFDYDRGGNIVLFLAPIIDAVLPRVHGVGQSVIGFPLGGYDWANIWMEA